MRWKLQNILISRWWLWNRINVLGNTIILKTVNYKKIKNKQISNITFNGNHIYVNKSILFWIITFN